MVGNGERCVEDGAVKMMRIEVEVDVDELDAPRTCRSEVWGSDFNLSVRSCLQH